MKAYTVQEELLRNAPLPLVAARIRRARKSKGLSHDRLGVLLGGVSRRTLIGYEKAEHRPGVDRLEAIAAATGHDFRWFVDPEVDPSPFQAEAA